MFNLTFYSYVVHWRRPREFIEGPISLFGDGITPDGICEGVQMNSWLVSAIASLARRPKLVKRLFITRKYNKHGIYR